VIAFVRALSCLIWCTQPYSLFNGLAGSAWFCADLLHVVKALHADDNDEPQARLAAALDAIYFPSCDLASSTPS
jgi:hypothetical protein